MKNYIEKDTFIKTRNMIAEDLKADFLDFLKERYGEAATVFKRDGKTKEIAFRAGEVTDKDGNFPVDVYASIDLHIKNYVDTKISGREVEAYDFEEEVATYKDAVRIKEEEKAKKLAEKKAKIERDKAAREAKKAEKEKAASEA